MTNSRTFVFCGHRGNMAAAPENTLLGFANAEQVGVDEIELDVRVTSDGELVILHDRTLARTAAAPSPYLNVPIEDLTFEQVRSVDLGYGQKVPTMAESLDATSVLLQVELKAPNAAEPLAKLYRDRPTADADRSIFTSFDSLSLSTFAKAWGDAPMARGLGFHSHDVSSNWRDILDLVGASMALIPLEQLTREIVDELHGAGFLVAGSLLENHGDVRRIVELGVDASASNAPEYAKKLLLEDEGFRALFPTFA